MIRITYSHFLTSAVNPASYPDPTCVDIAFSGRSNVGKSSLINSLLGRKNIARTSSTPGKTQTINFIRVEFRADAASQIGYVNFVDLPGYGYARVSRKQRESWKTMISSYLQKRASLAGIVVIVDIRHPADPKDIMMLELVKSHNIPFLVAATKSDKIPSTRISKILRELSSQLGLTTKDICAFSALKKKGISELMTWITSRLIQ